MTPLPGAGFVVSIRSRFPPSNPTVLTPFAGLLSSLWRSTQSFV